MAETKRYNVVMNNMQTVLKLSAKRAKELGLTDKDLAEKAAPKPANKARGAANKADS
jgi:hypothetical protein